MKKADYSNIIKMISNPDTLAEGLVELDSLLDRHEQEYTDMNNSVNTLRDTNARLALRITSPVQEVKEPEVNKTEQLINEIRKDMGV